MVKEYLETGYPKYSSEFQKLFSDETYQRYGVGVQVLKDTPFINFYHIPDGENGKTYELHHDVLGSLARMYATEKTAWKDLDLTIILHSTDFKPWQNAHPYWTRGVKPETNPKINEIISIIHSNKL